MFESRRVLSTQPAVVQPAIATLASKLAGGAFHRSTNVVTVINSDPGQKLFFKYSPSGAPANTNAMIPLGPGGAYEMRWTLDQLNHVYVAGEGADQPIGVVEEFAS